MTKRREWATDDELQRAREEMERKRAAMEAAKIAYLNRAPFRGQIPEYEDVRRVTQEFILANYKYQKGLYGKIRVKFSVANLLR